MFEKGGPPPEVLKWYMKLMQALSIFLLPFCAVGRWKIPCLMQLKPLALVSRQAVNNELLKYKVCQF